MNVFKEEESILGWGVFIGFAGNIKRFLLHVPTLHRAPPVFASTYSCTPQNGQRRAWNLRTAGFLLAAVMESQFDFLRQRAQRLRAFLSRCREDFRSDNFVTDLSCFLLLLRESTERVEKLLHLFFIKSNQSLRYVLAARSSPYKHLQSFTSFVFDSSKQVFCMFCRITHEMFWLKQSDIIFTEQLLLFWFNDLRTISGLMQFLFCRVYVVLKG